MGASAVLLFAVPSSPLAQPWSILGGNVVSAVTGVLIFKIFGHAALALGVAVACAILAMSLLRCLHPPGGAVAMTAVIGGPAIWHAGFAFPFDVVALNSFVLIATGWLSLLSAPATAHRWRGYAPPTPFRYQSGAGRFRSGLRRVFRGLGNSAGAR
jgi:CBS domain-containing membrane protein